MKSFLPAIALLMGSLIANAQEWQTDLETAKGLAEEHDRNIVLVFQGSDWCAPCIKLDHEVWTTKEFRAYAKKHFIMLKADFPRKKQNQLDPDQQQKNKLLAEKYNQQGFFPLVLVLDKSGNVLGVTAYKKMTPAEYIQLLTSFIS